MTGPKVHNKYKGTAPPDAVYIGRGSPWGNPFVIGEHGNRDEVCVKYEDKVLADAAFMRRIKRELAGKHLVCFCKPHRCHGDTLLGIANS